MRVATPFKCLLGLGRERVVGVEIAGEGTHQEVIVDLARRERRRMRCSRCRRSVGAVYDRSTRRWRQLDLVLVRCTLRAEVRRVDCPCCGVVAEAVPWARSGSLHERVRGHLHLAGVLGPQGRGGPTDARRLSDGRAHDRAGRR